MTGQKLYWVETADHSEDWFIVASDAVEAAYYHEDLEGYEAGEASAREVVGIPDGLNPKTGWPSDELLLALGARFVENHTARVVELKGQIFSEGMLEETLRSVFDDYFESQGRGRPNGTMVISKSRQ